MSDVSNKNTIKERLLVSLIYENEARSTGMEARGGHTDARVRKSSLLTLNYQDLYQWEEWPRCSGFLFWSSKVVDSTNLSSLWYTGLKGFAHTHTHTKNYFKALGR